MPRIELQTTIPEALSGKRLDQVLSALFPEHSRSRIQSWINAGDVSVNNSVPKQKDKVSAGDIVYISTVTRENDNDIIVINKPAGLVVHPGAGNPKHTLVNALLNHDSALRELPRSGIIHRLDKETTGLMVVARTLTAHTRLVDLLQKREIKREYQALVCGQITAGGTIENNIGRHSRNRIKMAVTNNGKPATTHYRVLKKFSHYSLLQVQLETGRTHQIRVHMAHIKHPVVGDPVYGKHKSVMKGLDEIVREAVSNFKRQALHAWRLGLSHPVSGDEQIFEAPLPTDMQLLLSTLETNDQH